MDRGQDDSASLHAEGQLRELWPLFGLRIPTSRLELRLPTDMELPALAAAARQIRDAGEPGYQRTWMYEPSPVMERRLLQQHWRDLAHWQPESWHLGLAAFRGNAPIGMQDLWRPTSP